MGYFRSKYDFLVQELVCNQAHHYNKCKYQQQKYHSNRFFWPRKYYNSELSSRIDENIRRSGYSASNKKKTSIDNFI